MSNSWRKSAFGWVAMIGGHRWVVRGPILGERMFWLYRDGNRYTPTGNFEDAVHFEDAAEAREYVERLAGLN